MPAVALRICSFTSTSTTAFAPKALSGESYNAMILALAVPVPIVEFNSNADLPVIVEPVPATTSAQQGKPQY